MNKEFRSYGSLCRLSRSLSFRQWLTAVFGCTCLALCPMFYDGDLIGCFKTDGIQGRSLSMDQNLSMEDLVGIEDWRRCTVAD